MSHVHCFSSSVSSVELSSSPILNLQTSFGKQHIIVDVWFSSTEILLSMLDIKLSKMSVSSVEMIPSTCHTCDTQRWKPPYWKQCISIPSHNASASHLTMHQHPISQYISILSHNASASYLTMHQHPISQCLDINLHGGDNVTSSSQSPSHIYRVWPQTMSGIESSLQVTVLKSWSDIDKFAPVPVGQDKLHPVQYIHVPEITPVWPTCACHKKTFRGKVEWMINDPSW